MVVVFERGTPGEGSIYVAWVHFVLAGVYGLVAAKLLLVLYRAIRADGPDDGVFGLSVVAAVLCAFGVFHVVTGIGARRQKAWARQASRVVAFLLFPAIPIGTGIALYLLRNTRPERWAGSPTHVDAPYA
jgi:multisubunit Na+/H+ antiporter MnhF subunit